MSNVIAADQLRLLIERIERLSEEQKGIADDIKDVYLEAKSTGFNPKTMRAIVARRKKDRDDLLAADSELVTYMAALGMQHSFDL